MARKRVEIVTIEIDGSRVEAKECTKCGEVKALGEYQSNGKGGKRSDCKVCVKAYRKENAETLNEYGRKYYGENKKAHNELTRKYYEENKKSILRKQREWYEENKESAKEYAHKYYEENKEAHNECTRKYYEENKEAIKAANRKWHEENKEVFKEYSRKWAKENPEKLKANKHRRRARKQSLPDTLTSEQTKLLLSQGCALTGTTDGIHLDHFIPLSWGHGGTTFENMTPLAAALNISKNDSNPFEWIKTRNDIEAWRWQELVEDLAELNGMTSKDYEEYVYECEANKRDLTIEGA